MNTNDFFKTLEEKGFDTQKLDVANLRNYLSVVSEDHTREYSEVMRLMQHKEELGFLGFGNDVMLEFSIEPADNGVTPGIHIDLLTVTDSSKEEYIRSNNVSYAHEDYIFYNVFECDSMEEFVGSVEELQTNIWPKYLKNPATQEWFLCTEQRIGRKISDEIYEFAEIRDLNPVTGEVTPDYVVYSGKINIKDYSKEKILDAITTFGYSSIEEIEKDCGSSPDKKIAVNQAIAECLFFFKNSNDLGVSPKFADFDDAVKYLHNIQKGENKKVSEITQEDYQKSLERAGAFDENLDNEKMIEFFNKRGQGFPRQPQDLGEIYFGENYNTALSLTVVGGDEPVMMIKIMSRTDLTEEPDTISYVPNVGNIHYKDIDFENLDINDFKNIDSIFSHIKDTYPSYFASSLEKLQTSEEKIADTNTPIILEECSLKDAGNWHIDGKEFGSVVFGEREIPPEGVYLGYVGYGNSLIKLHCVPNTEESKKGQLCISVDEYAPTMAALNPDSETKNFHLAVNNHLTLWTERVSEVPVNKTDFFCEPSKVSIDSFKEKAVAKMIEAEIISPSHYKEYKQLTEDNMDFASQVYEQDSKIEMYKSLSKIRPVETIRQNKLMPEDIEMLSVYYDQVADCLSDRNGLADATERIVEAMKGDGLDNARIGLVFKASEKLRNCLLEKGLASIIQHQTQKNRADCSKTR